MSASANPSLPPGSTEKSFVVVGHGEQPEDRSRSPTAKERKKLGVKLAGEVYLADPPSSFTLGKYKVKMKARELLNKLRGAKAANRGGRKTKKHPVRPKRGAKNTRKRKSKAKCRTVTKKKRSHKTRHSRRKMKGGRLHMPAF